MDLIQKFRNITFPPIALTLLLLIYPPFLVFKFFRYIIRSIYIENVAGKVVLITGASSGIGEHLAYEYARRGACLVLAARRENRLQEVASKACNLGSPDVMVIRADVTNVEDSKRLIQEAINHFGRLDHLVNNAGILLISMFEDCDNVTDFAQVMDTNFWGSVYSTHFAVSHLRRSKGKIIVIASAAGWFPLPRASVYSASKAALISFYETLRTELGSDIGITIATPGLVASEMIQSETLSKIHMNFLPVESTEACAKEIVNSACRGDRNLTVPSWFRAAFPWTILCPEVIDWCKRLLLITWPRTLKRDANSNKTESEKFLQPVSVQSPQLKAD